MGWIEGKSYTTETDSKNSSQTPLLIGDNFTGEGVKNEYASVMVVLSTDQNGTLYCEFSIDGQNWDTSLSFNYDTARINPPHIFEKGSRYFRVRFVNDSGVDQTYFRLGTYYGSFQKLTSPINGTLSENYDALVVRPTDYRSEVAMSKRQGRMVWNKWGYNDDVDSGGEEIIASWGGSWQPPTSAETVDFVSSSSNDSDGGTGLNRVVITGIDANREFQFEILTLDGTNTVTTSNTWLGINRVAPFLCGSLKTNDGTITGNQTTSNIILAQMPEGETVTQQAIFYVQSNHTFLTSWIHINVIKISGGGGNPEVIIKGYVYSPIANANIQVFKSKVDTQRENTIDISPNELFPVTEGSVLYFTAETDTNNTSVDLRFSGIEERIS